MDYFPAFLALNEKPCLLVGGGALAARKMRLLLDAGAVLTVVAPETVSEVDELARRGKLTHRRRHFRASDVDGQWLVVCATNDPAADVEVAAAAEAARVFCNTVDNADSGSYITPAIVDRGAVVVGISTSGTSPVLARHLRERIEAILPARLGELAALAGRWRQRVGETLSDFSLRLRFWQRVIDGSVATDAYAGNVAKAEADLRSLLAEFAYGEPGSCAGGEAWLVGAGPGDPELLTLKALQALQRADVILHDRLVSDDVLRLARRDAEVISVGKTPGCTANTQQQTNELLVRLVREGKQVCRLKGGDPFIFGRGGEEADALTEAGLKYRVVPGITAAAGCAAAAGIPLTHRDAAQSVVLVTGHGKSSLDVLDWASLARERQTLAIYMGVKRFADIVRELVKHGRGADTPIAIVERGTRPEQRVIRGSLGQLPLLARAHKVSAPAMLFIGEVTAIGSGVDSEDTIAIATETSSARQNLLYKMHNTQK